MDTSGSRLRVSPRSTPQSGRHARQRSLPNGFQSQPGLSVPQKPPEVTTLPQICIRRLVPTRTVMNKNICHIVSNQKLVLESLDDAGMVRLIYI